MVTISNYYLRNSKDGKQFVALELQGDLEMVQSMETGRFYATARKCSITSTFDELSAKSLVGKSMAGSIVRKPCDPYESLNVKRRTGISSGQFAACLPDRQVGILFDK